MQKKKAPPGLCPGGAEQRAKKMKWRRTHFLPFFLHPFFFAMQKKRSKAQKNLEKFNWGICLLKRFCFHFWIAFFFFNCIFQKKRKIWKTTIIFCFFCYAKNEQKNGHILPPSFKHKKWVEETRSKLCPMSLKRRNGKKKTNLCSLFPFFLQFYLHGCYNTLAICWYLKKQSLYLEQWFI